MIRQEAETPNPTTPSPQSQSLSRSYGSNLPTSLIYIILLTRGYSPWRPDAVISTDNQMEAPKSYNITFQGPITLHRRIQYIEFLYQ